MGHSSVAWLKSNSKTKNVFKTYSVGPTVLCAGRFSVFYDFKRLKTARIPLSANSVCVKFNSGTSSYFLSPYAGVLHSLASFSCFRSLQEMYACLSRVEFVESAHDP